MERMGVGVIGLGFMGQTHVRAYQAAAADGLPCELVAVCDASPQRLSGEVLTQGNLGRAGAGRLFDPRRVRGYSDIGGMLADPGVGIVSVCTYTDTHVELAIRAVEAGKHVLVEKPVAVGAAGVRRLAEVAARSGKLCMPGMCMRFWPGWDWMRDRVRDGSLGVCKSATFQRLGSGPGWAAEFYRDVERSGGPLWDLHIHDADFVYWCFGRPRAVRTSGTEEHFTTVYECEGGPAHVTAEGAWDLARGAGFRMRYLVTFEKGTVEFDLSKTPAAVVHRAEGSEPVPVGRWSAYEEEIRHFVRVAAGTEAALRATMEDAVVVAEILEAERTSLRSGRTVGSEPGWESR